MQESKTPKIRVLVRKRPMNKKELSRSETDIITIQNGQTVIVKQQKLKVDLTPFVEQNKYNFDGAYDELATNQYIYETAVRPLVDCAFDGAKVTCFAYGQTGSGKTHTMLGNGSTVRGLYLLAAEDLFQIVKNRNDLQVWISFYEIYCGKLYDLLNDKNLLFAREDSKNNVNIVGLSESKIQNENELMQFIQYGTSVRVTSQNGTNNDSSRSHAILQISLKRKSKLHGKISFIDLAGSERAADHADQLEKQTRIDGAEINKSLLALKECIRALDQNKHHTPFRGSKLTMVLKDSFTGYCRTVMIGNIAPNSASSENTLNTLKYADRVKQLKKAKEQPFDYDKIDQLERELMLPRNGLHLRPRAPTAPNSDMNHEQMQNKKALGNRSNLNQNNKLKVLQLPNKNSMKPQPPPPQPQPQHIQSQKRATAIQSVINSVNNANSIVANMSNNYGSVNVNNYVGRKHSPNDIRQSPKPNKIHSTMQREYEVEEGDIGMLSEKHDQYIELILEEEEKLIKFHQNYINETIEITKSEMKLRNEADKIGSNIEDYLDNLDQLLDQKLHSISTLKDKIAHIKGYLRESKKIEEQYSYLQRQMYQQQEQCLLDDDEELFV